MKKPFEEGCNRRSHRHPLHRGVAFFGSTIQSRGSFSVSRSSSPAMDEARAVGFGSVEKSFVGFASGFLVRGDSHAAWIGG
jgi:hypothetical protein